MSDLSEPRRISRERMILEILIALSKNEACISHLAAELGIADGRFPGVLQQLRLLGIIEIVCRKCGETLLSKPCDLHGLKEQGKSLLNSYYCGDLADFSEAFRRVVAGGNAK